MHLDESTAVIARLYVAPNARGSGTGRALMQHAIAEARAGTYRSVALDTDRDALPQAYALYKALGFRECEPFMDAGYHGAHFMELLL